MFINIFPDQGYLCSSIYSLTRAFSVRIWNKGLFSMLYIILYLVALMVSISMLGLSCVIGCLLTGDRCEQADDKLMKIENCGLIED